jgi:hypothetical protein
MVGELLDVFAFHEVVPVTVWRPSRGRTGRRKRGAMHCRRGWGSSHPRREASPVLSVRVLPARQHGSVDGVLRRWAIATWSRVCPRSPHEFLGDGGRRKPLSAAD